jgi:hypothetical protein
MDSCPFDHRPDPPLGGFALWMAGIDRPALSDLMAKTGT